MNKRVVRGNVFYEPENTEAKDSINRKKINQCPNCSHPFSIGEFGPGTHIEVRCAKCNRFFYNRVIN